MLANKLNIDIMPISLPLAIGVGILSLILYMSGTKGFVVIGVLLLIFMALVYFKQNTLLYMPGTSIHDVSCARSGKIIITES